jgi:hypothetical protein
MVLQNMLRIAWNKVTQILKYQIICKYPSKPSEDFCPEIDNNGVKSLRHRLSLCDSYLRLYM